MSRLLRALSVATAVTLGALGTVLVGTAAAQQPTCGVPVTHSVTLTADLLCNNGDGIVVDGASNIVINLAGHMVYSTAALPRNLGTTPCGVSATNPLGQCYLPADFVGIHILDSNGVTVQGGTVQGFSAGVAIEGGGGNTVRNIVAQNNQGPCIGEDFSTQAVGTYGDGIVIFSSQNNKITSNVAQNNGPFDGIGIASNTFALVQPVPDQPLPTGNLVANNTASRNNTCFADIGIRVEGPGASNNTVAGNHVANNFNEGIYVASVNTINFEGVFANPPTCQNRGFPSTQTVTTTSGSPVVTATQGTFSQSNVGATLSFAGAQPFNGTITIVSVQSPTQATLSANATSSQTGIQISTLQLCPILNPLNPANSNNRIINNQVSGNGFGGPEQFAGPVPPGTPNRVSNQSAAGISLQAFCGYGALNETGALIQGNFSTANAGNGINVGGCAQVRPPGTFIGPANNRILYNTSVDNGKASAGARDLFDGWTAPNPPCDNNTWFGNRYRTFNQPCVTTGGTQIAAAGTAAQGKALSSGGASDTPYPLRPSHQR